MIHEVTAQSNGEAFALLDRFRSKGAEVSYSHTAKRTQNVVLTEGVPTKKQVQDLKEKYVRVLHEGRLGYLRYNTEFANNDDLVDAAIQAAQFSDQVGFSFPAPAATETPRIFDDKLADLTLDELETLSRSIHEYIVEKDSTLQSDLSIGVENSRSEVVNSSGFAKGYSKTGLNCHVWIKKPVDDRLLLNYDNLQSCRLTDLRPLIDLMVEEISWSYNQVHLPPGETMGVVLSPSILSQIFKPFVSFFNAMSICQGVSIVGPRQLGQKIFDERITIRDDAVVDWRPQSRPFDSEGTPTGSNNLIENGKVNGFLCDLLHSKQLGVKPTGNFRFVQGRPAVFMNNVTIEPGTSSFRSMLKGIERGIFVGTGMAEWESASNLKIIPSNSYLIENGEIAGTIVEHFQLAGSLTKVFNQVMQVSSETKLTKSGMEIPYISTSGLVILR